MIQCAPVSNYLLLRETYPRSVETEGRKKKNEEALADMPSTLPRQSNSKQSPLFCITVLENFLKYPIVLWTPFCSMNLIFIFSFSLTYGE